MSRWYRSVCPSARRLVAKEQASPPDADIALSAWPADLEPFPPTTQLRPLLKPHGAQLGRPHSASQHEGLFLTIVLTARLGG